MMTRMTATVPINRDRPASLRGGVKGGTGRRSAGQDKGSGYNKGFWGTIRGSGLQ